MKNIKIVIGANYGDEGKGLMTRHFVTNSSNNSTIVVMHNGTAQRGHTIDYDETNRHVYHHFGCGSADGAATFFAKTFLIHPMEFAREVKELYFKKIYPSCYCDPDAIVITPLDMLVDHATEEHIAIEHGENEYGSCGYGSWCAVEDRLPMNRTAYTIKDFYNALESPNVFLYTHMMEEIWKDCQAILARRGVDIKKSKRYAHIVKNRSIIYDNFMSDLVFFHNMVPLIDFSLMWNKYNTIIFEGAQGLGLDKNIEGDWHTTSNTGLLNPYDMIKDKKDYEAEVCYVTRSYLTRHGVGDLENAVNKDVINAHMFDKTNVYNEFQGNFRYGILEEKTLLKRIDNDYKIVDGLDTFKKSIAITHCNEFTPTFKGDYFSDNPYGVKCLTK